MLAPGRGAPDQAIEISHVRRSWPWRIYFAAELTRWRARSCSDKATNPARPVCRESGRDITTAWQEHRQFETAQIDAAAFRIFTALKTGERRRFRIPAQCARRNCASHQRRRFRRGSAMARTCKQECVKHCQRLVEAPPPISARRGRGKRGQSAALGAIGSTHLRVAASRGAQLANLGKPSLTKTGAIAGLCNEPAPVA